MIDPRTMSDTNTRKTAGRRIAADGAATTATMLRKAGEASATAAAGLADALDAASADWAPASSRARRRIGIAVAVVLAIAVIAAIAGRRRSGRRAGDAAEPSTADLDEARQQRSAS
jgi:hypothetical protein